MTRRIAVVAILTTLGVSGAGAQSPTPVSPGSQTGLAVVSGRCPSFHWTAVSGAEAVDLVVYRVPEERAVGPSERVLSISLPGSTQGWTPSLVQCLEPGGRYAWSIGVDGEWSEASLFEIAAAPSVTEVEEALAVLRRFVGQEESAEKWQEGAVSEARGSPGASPQGDTRGVRGREPLLVGVLRSETVGAIPDRPQRGSERSAPVPSASPSLVVDDQIHLGPTSDIFKDGYSLLWSDAFNTAVGKRALYSNTTGDTNNAFGTAALIVNSTGRSNSAFGENALLSNTGGSYNSAFGSLTLSLAETGTYNIGIGYKAGFILGSVYPPTGASTYSHNIFIDNVGGADDENTIRIGNPVHEKTFIKGIRGATTDQPNAIPVLVDSIGQLGTASSSRAAKQDIENIEDRSARLLALRPVAFRFRKHVEVDPETPMQFGLIAEEVAEVFPELVVYGQDGRPETVKYHLLSSLLLSEIQKQHREQRFHRWALATVFLTGLALTAGRWRFG